MQLIGMMDSPFVRRVAISLAMYGLPYEHRALSVFRNFDEFAKTNPIVKAPTLITDDGTMLVDSSLILDYLEHKVAPERRLMPEDLVARAKALQLIGFALAACEKTMQHVYEDMLRPREKRHEPWVERVRTQLHAAYAQLETAVAAHPGNGWLLGDRLMLPDITVAVAWRFTQFMLLNEIDPARYPALAAFSARAEALPVFVETPLE
ncbi:glutathione S-transferase family protein [Paraburkholderia rhizosphaerae]|uniref:Glutathione S-transferase n=1 Tax=Paraburkholderia rhizosphaerae TaxID=480658 RepID=A0A4R8LHU7_9BURK|nr:glutathione S-transferase [Paraburkholderia rhizosphaerae]TDY42727.1 glutathione S-transferase [Paraburkholderia rhizosphaerae]